MDHGTAQDWLDRYVAAWLAYDRELIEALFSEDVEYRYHPYDDPIVGRDAVVASWLPATPPTGGGGRGRAGAPPAAPRPAERGCGEPRRAGPLRGVACPGRSGR